MRLYGFSVFSRSVFAVSMDETIEVCDRILYYAKVGHGPHVVLLMPATVSTTWLQYKYQIDAFPKEKFTIFAWNPLGYGRSESAAMEFSLNYFEDLADYAYEFMKALNIPKYSLLGWCGGGRVGMILASKHPEVVTKMVLICTNAFLTETEFANYFKKPDRKSLKLRLRSTVLAYGTKPIAKYWSAFTKVLAHIWENKQGDICSGYLKNIKCPTLIVIGGQDPAIKESHGEFLKENIADSRLHVYPDGQHRVHMSHADDFNTRTEAFLLE